MKNTDFLNLELPEREDKINVEVLTSDFKIIEDIIKQHAVVETMELDGVGTITGAIGPYIRLQNISEQQVSVDIGNETIVLESGENKIIRETAQNIGVITSGNVHITYFTNAKTYTDRNFYDKKKIDELLKNVEATVEVDAELSGESENPVQNKVITEQFSHYYTTAETDEKITEKVSEIVANAPAEFDTLKEMSDWLTEHEDSAATMNSAIQKNASDISTANTNIQKNVDNIAAAKNSIAINKSTLGIQRKNLFDLSKYITTLSSSANKGTIEKYDNGFKLTATSNDCFTYPAIITHDGTLFKLPVLPNTKYVLSWDSDNDNDGYVYIFKNGVNAGTSSYFTINNKNAKQLIFTTSTDTTFVTVRFGVMYANNSITYSNIMVRYAEVTDDTYEPYAPSLQEQINTLLARIEALEGAAVTTEGGE